MMRELGQAKGDRLEVDGRAGQRLEEALAGPQRIVDAIARAAVHHGGRRRPDIGPHMHQAVGALGGEHQGGQILPRGEVEPGMHRPTLEGGVIDRPTAGVPYRWRDEGRLGRDTLIELVIAKGVLARRHARRLGGHALEVATVAHAMHHRRIGRLPGERVHQVAPGGCRMEGRDDRRVGARQAVIEQQREQVGIARRLCRDDDLEAVGVGAHGGR
jgi:hypothetical protein